MNNVKSKIGKTVTLEISGASHAPEIQARISGIPAGHKIDSDEINKYLRRRAAGEVEYSTPRTENDIPNITSGIVGGVTDGNDIVAVFTNKNARREDYGGYTDTPRPSHADYTLPLRYGKDYDISGGGAASGRMTLPLCFAGALCGQLLAEDGIEVAAHILSIYGIKDTKMLPQNMTAEHFSEIKNKKFPVINDRAGELMLESMHIARIDGDSLGGVVECAAIGLPAGIGGVMYDGVEGRISEAVFGIPGVKGIEFGAGFSFAVMRGIEANDAFETDGKRIYTKSNNCGGILGGITSGMPLILRAVMKPVPSIGAMQDTVNLRTMENTKITVTGRHDVCMLPRAVPAVEAAVAFALYDMKREAEQ